MKKLIIIALLILVGFNGFGQDVGNTELHLNGVGFKTPLIKQVYKYDEFGDEISKIDSNKYFYQLKDSKKEVIPFKHTFYTGQFNEYGDIIDPQINYKDSIKVDLFLGEISKEVLIKLFETPFFIDDSKRHYLKLDYYIEFSNEDEYVQISRAEKLWKVKLNFQINRLNKGDIVLINSLSYLNIYGYHQELGKVYWILK